MSSDDERCPTPDENGNLDDDPQSGMDDSSGQEGSDGPRTNGSPKKPLKRCSYDDLDDPESPGMEPVKKLCRLYFLDKCIRGDQCYYMHSDFPCKFYHFGYECRDGQNCKLLHGRALDPQMKRILWNHITTAPANLMQRFPCFPNMLLRKNFEDRHNELLQMEQEGLLDDEGSLGDLSNPPSSTLLGEVIKTATNAQLVEECLAEMSEIQDILSPEHISALAGIGVKTKEQLFQVGASALLEIGFDYEMLVKIGNFKESHRRQSIYSEEANISDDAEVFGISLDSSLAETAPLSQPALTDQELYSILNDERDAAAVSRENSNNTSLATTVEGSFSMSNNSSTTDELSLPANIKASGVARVGSLLNLGYSLSDLEKIEQKKGITITASFSTTPGPPEAPEESNEAPLNTSDKSSDGNNNLQFTFFSAVTEKENDSKSRESLERTVEQLHKVDSLVKDEPDTDTVPANNEESNDSSASAPGSDSGSQNIFRLPFKSIIEQYTPATEIDASLGLFPNTVYKLFSLFGKPKGIHIPRDQKTCGFDPLLLPW